MEARVTHIVVNVSDMKRSGFFYTQLFHFLKMKKIYSKKNAMAYYNSMFAIWLHEKGHRKYSANEVGHHHIAIRATSRKQVDDLQKLLDKNGFNTFYRAERHPEFTPGYYSVSFTDPDGVIWELLYQPEGEGFG